MKKRVLSLLLAACLLFSAAPVTAQAAGTLEGVDYTRIEQNTTLTKQATFQVGGRTFTGQLQNGKTLTDEEVDQIIRGVMTSEFITSGMLIGAEERARDGLRFNDGRYVSPKVLVEFALASADIASSKELSGILAGDMPIPTNAQFYKDLLTGTTINKLFDFALGKLVGEGQGKLINALQNILEIAGREYDEYAADEERLQKSVAAALALEEFYALCNAEIEKAEKERGLDQWRLTCGHTVWTTKQLFGNIPVIQQWRLSCDLKRTNTTEDVTNWGGLYVGTMKLEIWHDMSNFDEMFLDRFFLGSALPFGSYPDRYDYKDKPEMVSKLEKTIENRKFSISLDPGMAEGGTYEKPFSFSGSTDDTVFAAAHNVTLTPKDEIMAMSGYQGTGEGSWEFEGFGMQSTINSKVDFPFYGMLTEGGRGIRIEQRDGEHVGNFHQSVAGVGSLSNDWVEEQGDMTMDIATDTTVFEDLYEPPKLIITGVK